MYENNYPNDFQRTGENNAASACQNEGTGQNMGTNQNLGQDPVGAATGTTRETGNTYVYHTQATAPVFQTESVQEPPKKEKKSGGGFKKVMLGICCGLLFGIFAGIGFTAVTAASDLFLNEKEISTGALAGNVKESDKEEMKEEENSAKDEEALGEKIEETKEKVDEILGGSQFVSASPTTVTDVTEVVKAVMPSVVSVNNKYVETTSFWGQEYTSEAVSTGSGIIVGQNDTELLLVTNYHVVEAAEELTVQFCDGEQVAAQQKGADADKDLAVIAVQLEDILDETKAAISIATLGDSNELIVGEPVIAIGNALGYGQSVTTGVVSALNRAIMMESDYGSSDFNFFEEEQKSGDREINTFIQTDAAINPGNSGGALLNTRGEVIGINSNKIGGSSVEGMGYAIPISDAKPIIEELMKKETRLKVKEENKGYLGITGIDVVDEYAEIYGMPKGVYVSSVSEGTGAYEAGLVRGDIITGLNGEEIKSMDELKNELSYYAAGDTVELTIMQGSPAGFQAKQVEVTLGEVPET